MKALSKGSRFTAPQDQGTSKLALTTALAAGKIRKQFLIAVGYSLLGIAFLGWFAWAIDAPARCWSLFCSPTEVSATDLENGETPYQVNWILNDYQPLMGTGTPVFAKDDPTSQLGTIFPLTGASENVQAKKDAQVLPRVFVLAYGDAAERLEIETTLQGGIAFGCSCEPAIRKETYYGHLETVYPNLDADDLIFVTPGTHWKSTIPLFACLMFFGVILPVGMWKFWQNYMLTNSFLEKANNNDDKRNFHVNDWRQGSILGASSVEADPFPSLPAKEKLPAVLSVILTLLFTGLWLGGFFGVMCAFMINVPWWGRALVVACSIALVFGARQMMAWGVEREPRVLDKPGEHSIESSIECQSFGSDLIALGFVDNCPSRSAQRKFFSCSSGHVLAMTGLSRRDGCYYVTFFTFFEDGSIYQTSSSTKYLVSRAKHEPLWTVHSCNEVDTESVLHQHVQLVKDRKDGNRLLVVSDKNVVDADRYLDQLSLQAMAQLWRKSLWKI